MRKKNLFLALLAMVLVCAISVTGTMAYLTITTGEVKNTFIAAGGGDLAKSLELKEHQPTKDTYGVYKIASGASEVTSFSYDVIPDVALEKDPFIRVVDKTDAPAYLYVEVVNGMGDKLTFTMDTCWKELSGFVGPNQGKVYVYSDGTNPIVVTDETAAVASGVNIIKDKKVNVANVTDVNDLGLGDDGVTLKFYGYLAQASVTSNGENSTGADAVYKACFTYTNDPVTP